MTLVDSPVPNANVPARDELVAEGKVLGWYLLRAEPGIVAVERYAAASAQIFGTQASAEDRAMLRFVGRHAWSLPFLDASSALLEPQALLRRKLFLMLSILETLPSNFELFNPPPRARWVVLLRLAWFGGLSVALVVFGLVIHGWSRRSQ